MVRTLKVIESANHRVRFRYSRRGYGRILVAIDGEYRVFSQTTRELLAWSNADLAALVEWLSTIPPAELRAARRAERIDQLTWKVRDLQERLTEAMADLAVAKWEG